MTASREARARGALRSAPTLRHYIRHVTRDRLLTPQEEADLGKRIMAAQKAAVLADRGHEASVPLARIVREGDRARELLLSHNMRLAVSMAKTFDSAAAGEDYTLEDRIQDASLGLMRAVEKFDPAQGYRFTTYASWWIRQSMQRGAQNTGRMQLPAHVWDDLSKLWRARHQLEEAGGVLNVRSLSMVTGLSEDHIERAMEVEPRLRTVDLDAPVYEGDAATIGDLLPDKGARPAREATEAVAAESLRQHLSRELGGRELFILERRFGMIDDREWTLQELGDGLGLTRERVRQIEKAVIDRLSNDALLRSLL